MCPVLKLLLKKDLMKARPTVCSPINQQAKDISVIQTNVRRTCYLLSVSLTAARITLEKLSEVYAEVVSL